MLFYKADTFCNYHNVLHYTYLHAKYTWNIHYMLIARLPQIEYASKNCLSEAR